MMRKSWMQMSIVLLVALVVGGGSAATATGAGEKPTVEVPTPEVSNYYVVESSVPVVYIATGLNFPDALVAGPPAALGDGPVLLVRTDSIPPAVQTELARLNPHKIIISGGSDVVSDGVAAELATYTTTGIVERLEGPTRYETAVEVSKANYPAAPIGVVTDAAKTWVELEADRCMAYEEVLVAIVPPVSGTVVIHAIVDMFFTYDTSSAVDLVIKDNSFDDCTVAWGGDTRYVIREGDFEVRLPLSHVVEVDPGLHTFSINALLEGDSRAYIGSAVIDAVFYPDP